MGRFVIQPHVRLQEWVAEERGYFAGEGLDYEFMEGLAGASRTTSAVQPADSVPAELRSGAFEDMQQGRTCDVSAACHWAVNAAATGGAGQMWGHAYSVSPAGIFVSPESPYERPEDLAGVPVAVSYHSGSHYAAIQGLEPFLQRSDVTVSFSGLPYDRVRLLMRGEVPAANVFGAQYYILEQLGYRKLVDTTFVMGFLVPDVADLEDTKKYFRALEKAQRDVDLEPERFKKYWLREMPEDLAKVVDVRRFGPGERIVFEPYTREMFEVTQRWMKSWDLLDLDVDAEAGFERAVLA
ncbi:MAG: ABC transporter substrate-binding protein [Actinomycetes bacterium]